jgi:hypothetical protein
VCAKLQLKEENVEHLNHVSTVNLFSSNFSIPFKISDCLQPEVSIFLSIYRRLGLFQSIFLPFAFGWLGGWGGTSV